MAAEELTREERREEYHHLLEIVEQNSGHRQPVMASVHSIGSMATSIGLKNPTDRLQAAVENGDLLRHRGRVCVADEETLTKVIEVAVDEDEPDKELIGKANQLLQEVRAGE